MKKDLKDAQMIVRINAADRERFVTLCAALDTSAAREVRRFIRDFLARHQPLQQIQKTDLKSETGHGQKSQDQSVETRS